MNKYKISNRLFAKRYLVFFLFIVLTLVFWLMNKLAGDYVIVLRVTPRINSSAANYSDAIDNTLHVQVRASGFFVLKKKFIPENVFLLTPENISGQSILKIPTSGLKENIRDYFDRDVHIISIEPDTVYFNMSEYVSKKVAVTGNFKLSFSNEFRQSAPTQFFPDSVTVTGSKEKINNLQYLVLPFKKYDNLDKTVEDILTLTPMSDVFTSHSKIRYRIQIERCTEAAVSVPIKVSNLPAKDKLILLPANVRIKYMIPITNYKSVTDDDFSVEADYNETTNSLSRQIKVKIVHKPDFVFNTEIYPPFVEFLIQK
ncbi:MAG: hypothetical protein LBD59_08835 [Prevotellaceae bacterium]|jgi:hypothetical protein|nr:hypothetical protein [Prevotellaceae bacterium]